MKNLRKSCTTCCSRRSSPLRRQRKTLKNRRNSLSGKPNTGPHNPRPTRCSALRPSIVIWRCCTNRRKRSSSSLGHLSNRNSKCSMYLKSNRKRRSSTVRRSEGFREGGAALVAEQRRRPRRRRQGTGAVHGAAGRQQGEHGRGRSAGAAL